MHSQHFNSAACGLCMRHTAFSKQPAQLSQTPLLKASRGGRQSIRAGGGTQMGGELAKAGQHAMNMSMSGAVHLGIMQAGGRHPPTVIWWSCSHCDHECSTAQHKGQNTSEVMRHHGCCGSLMMLCGGDGGGHLDPGLLDTPSKGVMTHG